MFELLSLINLKSEMVKSIDILSQKPWLFERATKLGYIYAIWC